MRVKVSNEYPEDPFLRQTPGGLGIWDDCQFFFDEAVTDCDFWVVYENLRKTEVANCPRSNTVLLTGEPPAVKKYPQKFTNQFGHIITCHRDIRGKDVSFSQTALPWHIGHSYRIKETKLITKTYDELSRMGNIPKTKKVSVISSAKLMTEGHRKRLDIVMRLKDYFGDGIDIFGAGIYPIGDKWDAIADYKYHIVIENSAVKDYWTEKLTDCYLAQSYPIYFGCPNLTDYFPAGSFTPFNIYDFAGAVHIIEHVLVNNVYEKSLGDLILARDLVLNTYNFFPVMTDFIHSHFDSEKAEKVKIKPYNKRKKTKFEKMFMKVLHDGIVFTKKLMGTL